MRKLVALAIVAFLLLSLGKYGFIRVRDALIIAGCTISNNQVEFTIDTEQSANAATIAAIAQRRGLPERAISIAYSVVQQESKMRNLDFGDRDSVGLFQQRPSQGWGSREKILQPAYASSRFFSALLAVPNWEKLPLHVAAQEVQRSADGSAYEAWEIRAIALTQAFTKPGELDCRFHKFGRSKGTPQDVIEAITTDWGKISTVVEGRVITITTTQKNRLAMWVMAHADQFGISQIRWNNFLWDRYGYQSKSFKVSTVLQITLQ